MTNEAQGNGRFSQADAEVRRLHKLYFDLVHRPPELMTEAEAIAELEARQGDNGDLRGDGTSEAAESLTRVDPLKKAERDLLDRQTAQIKGQRLTFGALNLIAAALLCSGGSLLLNDVLGTKFGVWLPAGLFVLLFSMLLSLVSWKVAREIQVLKESRKQPHDIPYLACLAKCYVVEYLGQVPEEARQQHLDLKYQQWYLIRTGGASIEETLLERNLYGALVLCLVLGFTVLDILKYGLGTPTEFIVALSLSLVLATAFVCTLLPMANVALALPALKEHDEDELLRAQELRRSHRASELKLLQVKQQQTLQEKEAERERQKKRIEVQRGNQQTLKSYRVQLRTVVFDLKRATDVWERERNFTREERLNLEAEKEHHERVRWLLRAFGLLLVVLATYPASITASQVFGVPYQFIGSMRFAPVFWMVWVVLMIVAELALVPNVAKLMRIRYARNVLDSGYQEQERGLGHRYFIYTDQEAQRLFRGACTAIAIAVIIVLLEFVSNLYYMLHFSDVDQVTAFFLALVTFFGLMGLTIPLSNNHFALDWIYQAIGRRRPLSRANYATSAPPKYDGYTGKTAEALNKYRQGDYIDPGSGKR